MNDDTIGRMLPPEDRDEVERLVERDPAGGLPRWLVDRDDEDGTEGFSMLGRGADDDDDEG